MYIYYIYMYYLETKIYIRHLTIYWVIILINGRSQ